MKNNNCEKEELIYTFLNPTDESVNFPKSVSLFKEEQFNFLERAKYLPIKAFIQHWIASFPSKSTRAKYTSYISELAHLNIILLTSSNGRELILEEFAGVDHKSIINTIENLPYLTKNAKIGRIDCYKSFIKFLKRITFGFVRMEK